jgi:hypothetical protein
MRAIAVALLALIASAAGAQQKPEPKKPVYDSAFAGYRPWKEEEPGRWREANDEMGRLGGHAGHGGPAEKSRGEKKK